MVRNTDQYVVGLDISMHDVTFPQKAQRKEELLRVRAYGPDVKSHIFAKTFNDVAKVHTVYTANISAAPETIENMSDLRDSNTRQR